MLYTKEVVTNLNRQLWISSAVIIGSIVLATIALYLLSGDIAVRADKISLDRGSIDKQTGILAVLATLKGQQSQAAVYKKGMDQLLPTQDGLIRFGGWLNSAAAANNVTANFAFQNNLVTASGATPGKTGFSFTVGGGLDGIVAFLSNIETQAAGFFVKITALDVVNTAGAYQANGQGEIYFRQ